jgi:hypothetical protein
MDNLHIIYIELSIRFLDLFAERMTHCIMHLGILSDDTMHEI